MPPPPAETWARRAFLLLDYGGYHEKQIVKQNNFVA
jgi:hypothetical protein